MTWPMVKLGDVVTVNPRLPKDANGDEVVSFVAMASASEEGSLLGEEIRALAETKKGFTYFEKSDVLLAKITPCFENGKCLRPNQISNNIGFGSTEFHVLRSNESKIDPMYLFYMVWSERFRTLGEHSMSGAAGQKRVSADFLRQFEIPLPPLEEQKRIAAILDKADAIRRKRQQAIDLADEFLRSVFLDMFGDPVTNPKGWEVKSLNEFYVNEKDGTKCGPFGSALKKHEYTDSGIPVWNMDNITLKGDFLDTPSLWISESKYNDLETYNVKYGDVIISRAGTVGKMGVVKSAYSRSIISTNLIRVRFSEKLYPEYFVSLMTYCKGRVGRLKTGPDGAFTHMNTGILNKIEFPCPPLDVQKKYLRIHQNVLEGIDKQVVDLNLLSEGLNALSLKAFSGEL